MAVMGVLPAEIEQLRQDVCTMLDELSKAGSPLSNSPIIVQSEVENHMSQSPGCRPCNMDPTCAGCKHRGLTCGTGEMAWAEPFCSGHLITLAHEELETMLASNQVKGIPKYAAATVQHAIVNRQQKRVPIVRTETRSAAALALLCAQITDYQAVDVDTLPALACWTQAARVEHSLVPLESSNITRREWESTLRTAFPCEKWPEDVAFGSLSTNKESTGVELRFVVRNKMVSIACENGILYSVLIGSDRSGKRKLCADPEGRIHDVLRYCYLTMPFTNGFASMPPETVQHITDSSARGEIQAVGCFMRTSGDRNNDVALDGYREENLVFIERFEHDNLVDFSPVKVTAQRLDRKGIDSIAFVLSGRQSRGERECVLEMRRLRNAHPRGQPIYLNLIVRGPDGLTATQDQCRRWAAYWETEDIFVTLYVQQKVIHREIPATQFCQRYMRWSGRMDGYFSGPIVNAASIGARDPNSPHFDQKVHDFWELNNVLAQGKHNGSRSALFADLPEAWILNRDRNIV